MAEPLTGALHGVSYKWQIPAPRQPIFHIHIEPRYHVQHVPAFVMALLVPNSTTLIGIYESTRHNVPAIS